jgi:beta-fructofuranosidase
MRQYFSPAGEFYVGDCMPFWHDGIFHLFWLLDEQHHKKGDGLGYHQWAHSSTRDLVRWEEHPLALPITESFEASICTGSVFWHDGLYYAFYATRRRNWDQQVCVATSEDCLHFDKSPRNPIASPPAGYRPKHYRDPFVFRGPDGCFHMLVSAELESYPLAERGGCLAHLISKDLWDWKLQDPFLIPGYLGVPECADYFEWNGWYYLLFGNALMTRYRRSREPFGPWEAPPADVFEGPQGAVMKTAAFGEGAGAPGRRIGVAHLVSANENYDEGSRVWGGNAAFRELVQRPDGTLGMRFPAEMTPRGKALGEIAATQTVEAEGFGLVRLGNLPAEVRVTATATPLRTATAFGLTLRANEDYSQGYEVRVSPAQKTVEVRRTLAGPFPAPAPNAVYAVEGLDGAVTLEVICQGDVLDICVNGQQCLAARLPQTDAHGLCVFCHSGAVRFENIAAEALMT